MTRRWLAGLAVLAVCSFATIARAQQPAPGAPPADAPPAEPPFPAAAPSAPPADAPPSAASAQVETLPPAPAPPVSFVAAPASPAPSSAPARVPIARHWWFWAGLSAAAVGLVVGAIALSPRQPYMGNASPGLASPF